MFFGLVISVACFVVGIGMLFSRKFARNFGDFFARLGNHDLDYDFPEWYRIVRAISFIAAGIGTLYTYFASR
jgi:hypothetical protein